MALAKLHVQPGALASAAARVLMLMATWGLLWLAASAVADERTSSPRRGGEPLRIGVHAWNQAAWAKLRPVLRPGDFVLVADVQLGQTVARELPGVHVVYARRETDSIQTMDAHLRAVRLPPEIEYVRYDFEPEYQPEFTWVQADALPHFQAARDICDRFGKKVFPAPMNPFRREAVPSPWDSGQIALRSHDVLNVQLQRTLERGADEYQRRALIVRDQVRASRPDLTVMVQVSCNLSQWLNQSDEKSTQELIAIGRWVRDQPGIGGLFVFARSEQIDMAATIIREVRPASPP